MGAAEPERSAPPGRRAGGCGDTRRAPAPGRAPSSCGDAPVPGASEPALGAASRGLGGGRTGSSWLCLRFRRPRASGRSSLARLQLGSRPAWSFGSFLSPAGNAPSRSGEGASPLALSQGCGQVKGRVLPPACPRRGLRLRQQCLLFLREIGPDLPLRRLGSEM